MECKTVFSLLLRDLKHVFLNSFHVFAHQFLRLIPVSGNNGFHQLSVLVVHLKSGIVFLHDIGTCAGNDLLSQLRCSVKNVIVMGFPAILPIFV